MVGACPRSGGEAFGEPALRCPEIRTWAECHEGCRWIYPFLGQALIQRTLAVLGGKQCHAIPGMLTAQPLGQYRKIIHQWQRVISALHPVRHRHRIREQQPAAIPVEAQAPLRTTAKGEPAGAQRIGQEHTKVEFLRSQGRYQRLVFGLRLRGFFLRRPEVTGVNPGAAFEQRIEMALHQQGDLSIGKTAEQGVYEGRCRDDIPDPGRQHQEDAARFLFELHGHVGGHGTTSGKGCAEYIFRRHSPLHWSPEPPSQTPHEQFR